MDIRQAAEVIDQQFQGAVRKTLLRINGLDVWAMAPASQAFGAGQAVTVGWSRGALHAMNEEGNDV